MPAAAPVNGGRRCKAKVDSSEAYDESIRQPGVFWYWHNERSITRVSFLASHIQSTDSPENYYLRVPPHRQVRSKRQRVKTTRESRDKLSSIGISQAAN